MEIAAWFHKIFGDRYFIEIQNNGLEIQRLAMEGAVEVAKRMGLPLVATSDAHYVNREDAEAQDVLLCINTGKFRTDTQPHADGGRPVLPPQRRRKCTPRFPGFEDALRQSQEIADSVDIELDLGKRHFPAFTLPPDKTAERLSARAVPRRASRSATPTTPRRCADGELSPEVIDRLDRELDVINKLGFPNYFLIVWDFVRYSREQRHSGHGPRHRRRLARLLRALPEPRLPAASTTCCSSDSSTRAARKRPISTSTSARIAAAR